IKAEQEAKRSVTRFSRAIVDLVATAGQDYQTFTERAQSVVLNASLSPAEKADQLTDLYQEAVSWFEQDQEETISSPQMSCAGDMDVSPLFITTHPDSLKSNNKRTSSNELDIKNQTDNGRAVELALEKEPCGGGSEKQHWPTQAGRGAERKKLETNLDGVSIGLIQSACSQIQSELDLNLSSWPELCDATDQMRILIGLSQAGLQNAMERQGKYLAAACLAVVAEKALRDPQQISSPGGYFRAMIDRAGDGKLHLHKSLHGLV
ncbi:replication initiation protein RepC, partial [Ekhidna sp.]